MVLSLKSISEYRDGKFLNIASANSETLEKYYLERTHPEWHARINPHLSLQIRYMKDIQCHFISVDSHKNKRYVFYAQTVQIF